jgi:protein-S-isoprenylcysteine O-methyltransferase Ste14
VPVNTQFLETKVPAPVVAIAIAVGMRLMPHTGHALGAIETVRSAAADISANLSLIIVIVAFATFLKSRTTINPLKPDRASVLVTHGIYRYTRNPMYLSLALLLLSQACVLWSWAAFIGPIAYVAYITRFQILPEERILESKFGSEYTEYKRRVRRWI